MYLSKDDYTLALRPMLLYGSGTSSLRADVRRAQVFEHRSLCSIGRIEWENVISNSED